jgi:hypothetical protein
MIETKPAQQLSVDAWVRVLREEYLADFVPSGGSAVKFVSGGEEELAALRRELAAVDRDGFFHATLDPTKLTEKERKPDLHRTERFFLALTAELDWKEAARRQARKYLRGGGIDIPPGHDLSDLDAIAERSGRPRDNLLAMFQRDLVNQHLRDFQMGAEFRNAIAALVVNQLTPESLTPTTEEVLVAWLRGVSLPGGARALKRVQVFERINSGNAWTLLRSFTHWLPEIGYQGLVAVLDFRPYEAVRVPQTVINKRLVTQIAAARERGAPTHEIDRIMEAAQSGPQVFYSQQAYMRMLALLRRFIDATATLERTLLVVLTTPAYYPSQPEPRRRSYFDYDALQTRIGQEVHDLVHPNPCAALVHLGGNL